MSIEEPTRLTTERLDDGRRYLTVRIARTHEAPMRAAEAFLIERGAREALDRGIPFVCDFAANGVEATEELAVTFALGAAAKALTSCSGRIPTIAILDGDVRAGPALVLGLFDHLIVIDGSHAFVTGPSMAKEFTGVDFTRTELGGSQALTTDAGVASLNASSLNDAEAVLQELLSVLPSNHNDTPPTIQSDDPVDRPTPEAGELLPEEATGAYDVRDVIESIADDGWFLELKARFATNLITGFASFGGVVCGVVANQPMSIAGTLDIPSSQKGGRFVAFCDAFNIPLLTLVDTSGFYPGKDLEWRGMIRYGAQLAFAYARATVPRINVTLRKSYGGAYIVMDSKYMGNDVVFAWPTAEIAVMGAKGAVEILHRKAAEDERAELERSYEERLLNPYVAAQRGSVDEVIAPSTTRFEVASTMRLLASKREYLPERRHDNTPL